MLEEKTYLKTNLNLKSNDVYSINNLNNLDIKLGTFTNINKNFDENQSVNAFEYENVNYKFNLFVFCYQTFIFSFLTKGVKYK